MQAGENNSHSLSLKGLRPVIAYLEQNPGKTHLVAVKAHPGTVHNFVVTPKSVVRVVSDLRKQVRKSSRPTRAIESVIQTIRPF